MNQDTRSLPLLPDEAEWLKNLRLGDPVTRWLAGAIPMHLAVTDIHGLIITAGLWTFDRRNGAEIDEDIGWGIDITGSFIRPPGWVPPSSGYESGQL